ncbi:hypothetical protein EU527_01480 [Candidatus Thorarchaeota archaeon]|nr:MAG: hypothetical protein EU527_01480 [Candidatus Thorarchaeota archaeon]
MQNIILLGSVKFLHDLFTAIWIGGLITMSFAVLPSLKSALKMTPEGKALSEAIMSRLSKLVLISIVGLFITGIMLTNTSPLFEGYLSISNQYSLMLTLKHILIGLMVLLSIARSRILKHVSFTNPKQEAKISATLLFLNTIIGIIVLLLSGFISAFGVLV